MGIIGYIAGKLGLVYEKKVLETSKRIYKIREGDCIYDTKNKKTICKKDDVLTEIDSRKARKTRL